MAARRSPSRWLTDVLPTWLLASPWESTVLTIAAFRATLFLFGVTPATAAEQSLPSVLLYVVLSGYGLAAVFTLVQVARGDLAQERIGLMVLGPVALAYGITIISAEPVKGIYSFCLYGLVAIGCFLRGLVIAKLLRIAAWQLRGKRR